MKKITVEEKMAYYKMLLHYLKIHEEEYSQLAIDYLLENFLAPMPIEDTPDLLKQIYAAFDLLLPEENCYLQFAKMIGDRYGWDAHVLEIGGGWFPTFSKYVDDFQGEYKSSGTITTYDPKLVVNELGNVKLHKELFQEKMSFEPYDLIVGIMPCEATSMIIRKAVKEKKEFFLPMCGCIHYQGLDLPRGMFGPLPIPYEKYVEKVYGLAKEQEQYGFEVTQESAKQYSFKYPVISSRKK